MEGFVTNLDLFMFIKNNQCFNKPRVLFNKIVSMLAEELSEEERKELKLFSQTYVCTVQKKWKNANRTTHTFLKKYENWLERNIAWPNKIRGKVFVESISWDSENRPSTSSIEEVPVQPAAYTSSVGTTTKRSPRKPFNELSQMQKKRRTEELRSHDFDSLMYATVQKGHESGNDDIADIINFLIKHPEETAKLKEVIQNKKAMKFSNDKALGLFISLKLTKWQYKTLRTCAIEEGLDIYPSYDCIVIAKKACYPPKESVNIDERHAKVELQAILDITVSRLAKLIDTVSMAGSELTLVCKWGFDGASGQSQYKQTLCEEDDSSIFMSSFVPLKLTYGEISLWENTKASSTMYCRPIYFKFANENKLNIKEEMATIEAEIAALIPSSMGNNIVVKHTMLMTMIDGKITSKLSETSNQTCDICKAVPSEMNNLTLLSKKPVSSDIYKYGLSSLHAWIRCMECLLHISYRLDLKKWQARDPINKAALKTRKSEVQEKLRTELNILVDVVKQNAGSTNDGNTARRFFENPTKTASCTGLDIHLIKRLSVILRVISSGESIHVDNFAQYTQETAQLFVSLYGWYNMPASVHKLLIHGAAIIKHLNLIPIGKLSEEASEARNKDFKNCRLHHTRKISRIATNQDIFNYLIISSDPYLSSIRPKLKQTSTKILTEEMKHLLVLQSDNEVEEENTAQVEFVNVEALGIIDSDFENITEDSD